MKKIAVPVDTENYVDSHFGHCEFYKVFTLSEDNTIKQTELIKSANGCGCKSNIAIELAGMGVTVMLAGGIGGGAINVLNHAGIEVVRGCSGNADALVLAYAQGNVADNGQSCTQHENHHDCNN